MKNDGSFGGGEQDGCGVSWKVRVWGYSDLWREKTDTERESISIKQDE